MKWQRHELVGRRAELDALRRHSAVPALLVVRGPEGSGRTALLRRFRAECDGVVLDLAAGPAWDEFRARALLDAVRVDFETLGGGSRVAEAIEAVSRLCVADSYATPARRHRLLGAISMLLTRIRVRLVIVVDDADEVPVSALAPVHRAGHTVVVACRTDASRELCSLADLVVDLAPLTEDEIGRLLWQVAAAPVDEAVPRALRENLGPLYGNAATLVSTVESLWDEGRLGKVHGVLALRAPRASIALPAGHRLLAELDEHARVVVRLATAPAGFRVDQIPALAESTGRAAHDYGHAVDRLVRAGVLAHEAGRLRCRIRAVAAEDIAPRVEAGSVRQLISAADYEGLAELVATAVDGDQEELAAAAALAAIHTGRPVPDPVRATLPAGPLALADRWFAGESLRAEDVAECLHPFRRRARVVDDGADGHDLVPVLRSVLGPLYRPPTEGPVAAYHRVCRGYADGDWGDALSAARELEFMSDVDTPVLDAARLLAAEICGWRGEDRQAVSWLAAVGEDTRFPGLRGWVATALREQDAFAYGWDWYTTHADRLEEPGAARLLTRLASIAADADDRYRALVVLRETRDRYGATSETGLLVRGIVEGDGACVRAAERVIRERGTRFELVFACERLARLSGEPRPWLSEAYELARSIGAAKLVSTTRRAMAGCGVTLPARRARQADVSDVERQIVELIRLGKTNRQIALALRVSAKTVEKYLTRLFAKAGCRTRHGLATSGLGEWHELVGA
jgi:DNA-binding CsgD family transcriptional regulator